MRLSAIYKKSKTPLLTSDRDALFNTNSDTIIAGSLNAKHFVQNSRSTNTSDCTLQSYLDTRLDTSVAILSTPTHYPDHPKHRPDVLNIALLKTDNLNFQLTNFPAELSSDYSPIILDLNFNASCISLSKKSSYVTYWENFQKILSFTSFSLPVIYSSENIEQEISRNFSPPQFLNALLSSFQPIPIRNFPNKSYAKSS